MPTSQEDAWQVAVLELIDGGDYSLVIPATEMATYAMNQCRSYFATGTPVSILNQRAYDVSFDKQITHHTALQLGVPVPQSWLIQTGEALRETIREMTHPVVVKSACSVNATHWHSKYMAQFSDHAEKSTELSQAILSAGSSAIIQEFFDGVGMGVEFLAMHGQLLYLFQHRRLHETMGYGSTYRESVSLDDRLIQCVQRLIAALDYCGVGMAEFRMSKDGSRFALLEINGRFWGSLPLAVAAGADFPYFLYRAMVHHQHEFTPGYNVGVRSRELLNDMRWQWRALRGRFDQSAVGDDRTDGWTMNRLPRSRVLADCLRVVLPHEHIDSFALDDPTPAVAEVRELLRVYFHKDPHRTQQPASTKTGCPKTP